MSLKDRKGFKVQNRINNSRDEDDEDDFDGERYLGYAERTKVIAQVKVFLDEHIKPPKYYRKIVDKVISLDEEDLLIYYVQSIGGRMDGLISLIEANRQCPAEIYCVIMGECHSAASMFALSCPNISVSPSASMMIHYVSFGAGGKASDIKANIDHTLDFCSSYFRDIYEGFLTEDEITACIESGKELWLKSDEIVERLEKRKAYFDSLREDTPDEADEEVVSNLSIGANGVSQQDFTSEDKAPKKTKTKKVNSEG